MERNKVFDAAKYILITLVIIGHFIEPSRYTNDLTCRLYCLIYSFHMPLFVFISGYFYKQRDTIQEIKKCIPLLEIVILSHLGFLLLRYGGKFSLGNVLNFGGDPAWYLLSLIYWRIGTGYLLKKFSAKQILFVSILLDLISFLILRYGSYLSIGRTISFYPFFMLGYCLKGKISIITKLHRHMFLALGILSMIFIIYTSSILQFQIEFQKYSVFELIQFTSIETYMIFIYRYAILICSVCISALLLIIVDAISFIQKLSIFGQSTLFIYYIQTFEFAVVGAMNISLYQSLLIALVSIPILTYLSTWRQSKYLMNPFCSLFHKL